MNILQNENTIAKNIKTTFCNCGYVEAKIQLRFSIILEGPNEENEGSQIISDNSEKEKQQLQKKHYVISKQWMTDKTRSSWGKDNYAKPRRDLIHDFRK
jgi:hypothetical protein